VLVPIVVALIALSVYPQVALHRSEPTVNAIVKPNGGLQAHAASTLVARTP
jgi:NADH:ubiquinone oxidoreductase subunit 4 (subunit M)